MKIIITEEQKKKLFIPRKLSGEDSRWADWNKDQPIKDGIRINQYDIVTGKKEGIWEAYNEDGQLETKGSFNNGKEEGYWEEYYSNGQLYYKGSYKNGEKEGIWEKYYDNGQLYSKLSFKNGKEEGYWESYYSNGQLMYKGLYKNDKRNGIWEEYYDNGQLYYKGSFNNGKKEGYWEAYHSNGQLMSSGSYKNDKKDGNWEWYHDNGQLMYKGSYKNGELIKKLDESEQPKKKLFIPRKLSGEDSRWADWNKEQSFKNGEPINQYNINTGKKQGYWEHYYEDDDGELWHKGLYIDNKKEGIWEFFHHNGNLFRRGLYENGERTGIWERYWRNGKLEYKELYNNGYFIKKLPLTESETPKKKLFIPRKIDEREDQLKVDIKKFLNKIKDSDIWDILGKLESSYDYDSNYYETLYYNKNNKVITPVQIAIFYKEKYDKETANEMIMSFYEKTGDISDFMIGVMASGGNISFVWSEIINLGDGKLKYREHISKRYEGNDEYFEEKNYRVVSL